MNYIVKFHNRIGDRERPATLTLARSQAITLLSLHWPNRDEPDVTPEEVLDELDRSVETKEFSMWKDE